MVILWHYSDGDLPVGPVATEQIRELIAAGKLKPDDMIWPNGFSRRMAVKVSVLIHEFCRDSTSDNLPEWFADVAHAEELTVPEWVHDVHLWERAQKIVFVDDAELKA